MTAIKTKPQQSTRPLIIVAILLAAIGHGSAAQSEAHKGVNVGPGEMGIDAVIVEGPPIVAEQVMSNQHMPVRRGMTCAECHNVRFDLDHITSATQMFVNNFANLEQDDIWSKIVAFLPGRERFAIATVNEGYPTATTVDMVLDPDERVLFVVSEKGTEKLLHIRKQPHISAVRFAGWTVAEGGKKEWRSVQIKGQAEIIESDDSRFMPALEKYNLVRVTKERATRRFDLIRVIPERIYYFDTTLGADQYSPYQLWQRDSD